MYVPEFVALYEIIPYIRNLPLDNKTIRYAVKDYLEGGEKKDAIVKMYGPIGYWNTSEVTDMSRLFEYDVYFNEDISDWDTSKVNNMICMFACAWEFDQSISDWDVSKVTDMKRMFYEAGNFNQDISGWNISEVTDMGDMFIWADNFDLENAPWYSDADYENDSDYDE